MARAVVVSACVLSHEISCAAENEASEGLQDAKEVDHTQDCWTYGGADQNSAGLVSQATCCAKGPCGGSGCWKPPEFTYYFCCNEPSCRPLVLGEVKRSLLDLAEQPQTLNSTAVLQRTHRMAGRHLRFLRMSSMHQTRLRRRQDDQFPTDCECAVAMAAAVMLQWPSAPAEQLIAPTWFTHELSWQDLLATGWSPLFGLLMRPLPALEVAEELPLTETFTTPVNLGLFEVVQLGQEFARRAASRFEALGHGFAMLVAFMRRSGLLAHLWGRMQTDIRERRAGRRCAAVAAEGQVRWERCQPWIYSAKANFSSPRHTERPLRSNAVCVLGAPRTVVETFSTIRKFVVDPLAADVFAYVPFQDVLSMELEGKLRNLGPVVTAVVAPDVNVAGMRARFSAEVADQRLFEAYRYAAGPYRSPIHGEMGSVMWSYFAQSICRRMVQAHEKQRGGRRYRWVIFARADMYWTKVHPPIELLDDRFTYVPFGQDNSFYNHGSENGLNDRHAVIPRVHMDNYLGRWEAYTSGRSWSYLEPAVWKGELINAEQFLLMHLRATETPVARFPPVAYLAMCIESPQCFHLYRGTTLTRQKWTFTAKYMPELVEVVRTTYDELRRHQRIGWLWVKTPLHALDPDSCGSPWELHGLDYACNLGPNGPVSSRWWDLRRQCRCLQR